MSGTAYHGVGCNLLECGSVKIVGGGNAAPCSVTYERYHCGVAVAADYDALDLGVVGSESVGQTIFETRAVKSATHADDTVFGQTAHLVDEIGHGVHGVGDADDHCVGRILQQLLGNALDDTGIDADKLLAGHARLAGIPEVMTTTSLPSVAA